MNPQETILHSIANIVMDVCSMQECQVTKEQILGSCRTEHVIMARCILVRLLVYAGFQTYTISSILHYKNMRSVMHLQTLSIDFRNHNYIYKQCEDEAFRRFLELKSH